MQSACTERKFGWDYFMHPLGSHTTSINEHFRCNAEILQVCPSKIAAGTVQLAVAVLGLMSGRLK